MEFKVKLAILILGVFSLMSLANAACNVPKCFDCNKCKKDCTKLRQDCDTDCIVNIREVLCKMENDNCVKVNGCGVPPVAVTIYPAANYDVSKPEWKAQTIQARKNCCYKLTGIYNKTLSGLKNNGACVQLFDGANCTGKSIKVDSKWSVECLKWIDCTTRIKAGGIKFNDLTSSFQLC